MSLRRPLFVSFLIALAALALPTASTAQLALPVTAEAVAAIRSEKNAVATLDISTGQPAVRVELPADSGYPGINFPLDGATLDLSAFTGIELEVSNISQTRVRLHLRVDNNGDWKNSPWNTERVMLAPGETKTLRLFFGLSQGQPAYKLDPKLISAVKLFADAPKQTNATILIKSLVAVTAPPPVPVPTVAATPAAPRPSAPPLPEGNSESSPPISGELVNLSSPDALTKLKFNHSTGKIADGKLTVSFATTSSYPNLYVVTPKDGLDLSAFAGIELTATNTGTAAAVTHLRVENRPNARADELGQKPWNTEKLTIKPGETVPLRLTFGQNNGSPGYDLHAGRVSAIQVFLVTPKPGTTLVLSDIKAWGSAGDRALNTVLTKPSDRSIPVTPPAWLGQRPPVEGNWVQTLDENFDGEKLNDKLWTPSFPWDGLQPGQLQRYSAENVTVSGGHARFKAEKRRGHHNDDPARPARDYTSGIIQSYDKFTQLYGYMESRIKLPTTRGLWPAFWTMPDRGAASGLNIWQRRSTSNGAMEIDIMEHLCEWGAGRHNAAVHWDDYGVNHKAWGTGIFYGPTPDGWHVFGLLWEPGKLTWFIDGKKAAEWENERVSIVPAYIKLNIQIGGWATKNVDDAKLPDYMTVDYVRTWQLRERLKK